MTLKNHSPNEPFESKYDKGALSLKDTELFQYLCTKSERVAAAVYALTDLISQGEPLRDELRRTALASLWKGGDRRTNVSKILEMNISHGTFEEKIYVTSELLSFWNIAFYGGYVSEGNYMIMRRELGNLIYIMGEKKNAAKETSSFSQNFFTSELGEDSPPFIRGEGGSLKGHVTDLNRQVPLQKKSWKENNVLNQRKGTVKDENEDKPQRKTRSVKKKSETASGKVRRKETIMNFIQKEGDVSVKDVAKAVQGLSEKTLQRELTALVIAGVLKKTGERRWSRYSLY